MPTWVRDRLSARFPRTRALRRGPCRLTFALNSLGRIPVARAGAERERPRTDPELSGKQADATGPKVPKCPEVAGRHFSAGRPFQRARTHQGTARRLLRRRPERAASRRILCALPRFGASATSRRPLAARANAGPGRRPSEDTGARPRMRPRAPWNASPSASGVESGLRGLRVRRLRRSTKSVPKHLHVVEEQDRADLIGRDAEGLFADIEIFGSPPIEPGVGTDASPSSFPNRTEKAKLSWSNSCFGNQRSGTLGARLNQARPRRVWETSMTGKRSVSTVFKAVAVRLA